MLQQRLGKILGKCPGIQGKQTKAYFGNCFVPVHGGIQNLVIEILEKQGEKTVTTTFTLINDGASWKLEDAGSVFGQALFGTLSSSPVEDSEEDS